VGVVGTTWSHAWVLSERVRRRIRQGDPLADRDSAQFDWVRENVPGKSFADIGGMFKFVGEISFIAEEAGATDVTMFDVGDPDLLIQGHEEWGCFTDKKARRKSSVRYVQGDFEEPRSPERIGVHDIVFYSGVLYHTPNPVLQLMHLRRIVCELAYISTITIPEIPGFSQACIYYPYLSEDDRAPFAVAPNAANLIGVGAPFDDRPMNGFANCWFGFTRSALFAMLRTARLEVAEVMAHSVSPFWIDLVVRPIERDPLLPPVSYFRERSEAQERGEPRWEYLSWYEEQRRHAANPPQTLD
jgi:hypothetical protein